MINRKVLFRKLVKGAAVLSAAIMMAVAAAGCGATGSNGESSVAEGTSQIGTSQIGNSSEAGQAAAQYERIVLKDLDVDKYVTVGDYKSIRVERPEVKVSDAELEELFNEIYLNSFPAELGVKDRAVEVGDTANIDYEGKKDGVAFAGGTAQGSNLTIGSHTFIDGFEDGLVGVMPGETVDLNLKFPDNYGNTELAGQAVVFTVKVNYIIPAEKTDEAAKNFGVAEVTNLEELRQYIYDYLYQYASQENESLYEEEVLDAFMKVCEFKEIPEEMFASYRETTRENVASVAASYGTDAETYLNYYYQMDMETFLSYYADNALKQNIAMQAIANREGLNVSDEDLNKTILEYAQQSGIGTVEEFLNGEDIEEYREYFVYEKVYDYLMEVAGQGK